MSDNERVKLGSRLFLGLFQSRKNIVERRVIEVYRACLLLFSDAEIAFQTISHWLAGYSTRLPSKR